jgi:hypothetical protein
VVAYITTKLQILPGIPIQNTITYTSTSISHYNGGGFDYGTLVFAITEGSITEASTRDLTKKGLLRP